MKLIEKFIRMVSLSKKYIKYLYAKAVLREKNINAELMDNIETLNYILERRCSVIRFGDGELVYINGRGFPFQKYDKSLSDRIKECLQCSNDNILICLPEPIFSCKKLVCESKWHWTYIKAQNFKLYSSLILEKKTYGNSFISRPYMVYRDKSESAKCFELLKKLWDKKNILIVEGEYSRNGIGNNLFENATSIRRILVPSSHAFSYYEEILEASQKYASNIENLLVLVSLGPAAKPLVWDLAQSGIWTIDIGHIDSEYEWFIKKAKKRIPISGKHTAELLDTNVGKCNDRGYLETIIYRIGIE